MNTKPPWRPTRARELAAELIAQAAPDLTGHSQDRDAGELLLAADRLLQYLADETHHVGEVIRVMINAQPKPDRAGLREWCLNELLERFSGIVATLKMGSPASLMERPTEPEVKRTPSQQDADEWDRKLLNEALEQLKVREAHEANTPTLSGRLKRAPMTWEQKYKTLMTVVDEVIPMLPRISTATAMGTLAGAVYALRETPTMTVTHTRRTVPDPSFKDMGVHTDFEVSHISIVPKEVAPPGTGVVRVIPPGPDDVATPKDRPPVKPGCKLDTDGDGNCPWHPEGCPK